MSLKDTHAVIPEACEYVTIHGKSDSADVIKDLEMVRLYSVI